MIDKIVVYLIEIYQKYISPHKGYCCAYRVHHNSTSCSQYAKDIIIDNGTFRSLSLINNRFKDCKISYDYIQDEYEQTKKDDKYMNKTDIAARCGLDACGVGACLSIG